MMISLGKQSPKILTVFMFAVIFLPVLLQADTDFGWYFTEGGVGVDSYWGTAPDIVIPDEIEGYPVVEIRYYCGWNMKFGHPKPETVETIMIPASVIRILHPAPFYRMGNLSAIHVSAGNSHLSSLDGVLFNKDKTSLIEFPMSWEGDYFPIPDSVQSIEIRAFSGSRLSKVSIPDSVTSIGDMAFVGSTHLTSLTIPDTVTSIGFWAFYSCHSLTSVYFMGEPPRLEPDVFSESHSDLVIHYAEDTPGWGATLDGIRTSPFTPWGKYVPITSELGTHTDTGNWLGTLEVTHDPWIWCEFVPCWFNIPEQTASAGNGWVYPPDPDTLLIVQIDGTDWGYSFTLNKWLYLTASGWVYML